MLTTFNRGFNERKSHMTEKRRLANMKMTKTERNAALFKDYKSGMNIVEMVQKYQITQTRIFQIISRFKEGER